MGSLFHLFQREPVSTPTDMELNHLLIAVPLPKKGVETRVSEGGIQLRRDIEPNNRILRWCINRFHFNKDLRLVLDTHGGGFWKLLDGHRNLGQISERMSNQFQMDPTECERAVILYTKMLMRRHFIVLRVATPRNSPEPEPSHA